MTTFQYRHDPELSQEFVNGSYELGEVRHIEFDGRDIIYRVGSALLDNSCCGNYGCGYGLVIGEVLASTHQGEMPVSTVRSISADDKRAEALREALMQREALGVVNFYTSTNTSEEAT